MRFLDMTPYTPFSIMGRSCQTRLSSAKFFHVQHGRKLQGVFYAQIYGFEGKRAQIFGKNQFSFVCLFFIIWQ
jgi:hypothetical protein